MKFYTTLHKYYCGIDLHAPLLYVCILDEHGNKVVHQKIKADPHQLHKLHTLKILSRISYVICVSMYLYALHTHISALNNHQGSL